jgi:hypothetical protein
MAETSLPKVLRTVVALFAVVALLGACGGDDGGKKDDKASDETDTSLVEDPCALLDIKDLSNVTGITFDDSEPGENSCTYTSTEGLSAIALNFVELNGVEPQVALDQAKTSCDEGTLQELDFTDADGGFACVVSGEGTDGVATVAATGGGVFAVLTGATLNDAVDNAQILQDLATILENALTA